MPYGKAEAAATDYHPEVTVSVRLEGTNLVISVADNGEGMTDEVKQRLFENFFTTKPIGQGTGLGMGITRDIIENKHGGTIAFESTLGEGTTFTIHHTHQEMKKSLTIQPHHKTPRALSIWWIT